MTTPLIRPAQAPDAPVLANLSGQLGYPADTATVARRLGVLLGQGDHAVLVAELEGAVVGWIHVFSAVRLESEFAELGGLVVDAAHRGRGIGRALVAAGAAWAREGGHSSLRVRSNMIREASHRFYRGIGFEQIKAQAVFTLPLAGKA